MQFDVTCTKKQDLKYVETSLKLTSQNPQSDFLALFHEGLHLILIFSLHVPKYHIMELRSSTVTNCM